MMYNEVTAQKTLQFIIPSLVSDRLVPMVIEDEQKRQTLWQLLKSTMENIDLPLIQRFEDNPLENVVKEAMIYLLAMKFQHDKHLAEEIELFLHLQKDIVLLEASIAKLEKKSPFHHRPHTLSFRSKWYQRRIFHS